MHKETIGPAEFAEVEPEVGDIVTVAGWGRTTGLDPPSDVLQEVNCPVEDDEVAAEVNPSFNFDNIICIDPFGLGDLAQTCNVRYQLRY